MAIENDVPSDSERETAADVAHRAMIVGWPTAIKDVGQKMGVNTWVIENMLNRVSKEQSHRDPSARIDELKDWEDYKLRRTDIQPKRQGANNSNIQKLSPGLRKFMLKKHPHLGLVSLDQRTKESQKTSGR